MMDEEDLRDFLFGESKNGARILERLNSEITKLRAELEQERELADILGEYLFHWLPMDQRDRHPALAAHAARRKK